VRGLHVRGEGGTALGQSLEILHDALVELALADNTGLVTLGKHVCHFRREARESHRRRCFLARRLFLCAARLPARVILILLLLPVSLLFL